VMCNVLYFTFIMSATKMNKRNRRNMVRNNEVAGGGTNRLWVLETLIYTGFKYRDREDWF
jgi:hypothetical protein